MELANDYTIKTWSFHALLRNIFLTAMCMCSISAITFHAHACKPMNILVVLWSGAFEGIRGVSCV